MLRAGGGGLSQNLILSKPCGFLVGFPGATGAGYHYDLNNIILAPPPPSNARAVLLNLELQTYSQNLLGPRSIVIQPYFDHAGTIQAQEGKLFAYEMIPVAPAGSFLVTQNSLIICPLTAPHEITFDLVATTVAGPIGTARLVGWWM